MWELVYEDLFAYFIVMAFPTVMITSYKIFKTVRDIKTLASS